MDDQDQSGMQDRYLEGGREGGRRHQRSPTRSGSFGAGKLAIWRFGDLARAVKACRDVLGMA
jgi:hypothetical protein